LPPLTSAIHIAILDDEVDITALLAGYLQNHGYRVTQLHSGKALMALMDSDLPALVLLDLGLPGEDGFVIARKLREQWRCGLVIVSGRGDAVDKVVGLEVGADDYVTKPFDMRELLARIHAVLRRVADTVPIPIPTPTPTPTPTPASAVSLTRFVFAGWQLDTVARSLTHAQGHDMPLTGGEFDLLCVFLQRPGRVLSRDLLLAQTRRRDAGPFDRTIDVQVGRLRKKLESDPQDPRIIKSVRGAGYILVPPVSGG
jgi:two-component system OmpR family response regulator